MAIQFIHAYGVLTEAEREPFFMMITGALHCADVPIRNLIRLLPDFLKGVPFQVFILYNTDTGEPVNGVPDDFPLQPDPSIQG